MDVFVDYNNLHRADRTRGLLYVVDKIITAMGFSHLPSETRISFRLYDGWYINRTPTRRAQAVSAELLAHFPLTRTISDGTNRVRSVHTGNFQGKGSTNKEIWVISPAR